MAGRVAIMLKGDDTGIIAEAVASFWPTVSVNDSRSGMKRLQYHSPRHARIGFADVLRISQENGWRVGYLGERHVG